MCQTNLVQQGVALSCTDVVACSLNRSLLRHHMSMGNHSVMLCSLSAVLVSAVLCEWMEDYNSRGHWKVCSD